MAAKSKQVAATNGALTPSPFVFDRHTVRTLVENGEPWFVAKDVCAVLGIKNPGSAISDIDAEEIRIISNDTNRGLRNFNAVSETGLYHLIFRSRKPAARRFFQWVAKDVLPQIRKTGQYQHPSLEQPTTAVAANSERLTKERLLGGDVAIAANDTMGVLERYIAEIVTITAIIDRSKAAARAFDVATLLGATEYCPHCRTPLPGLLGKSAHDLAELLAVKARELDIEWRRCQETLMELRRMARRTEGDAEDYLTEVEANRRTETPPRKH